MLKNYVCLTLFFAFVLILTTEVLTTCRDESWIHYFQLGLTNQSFQISIFTIVEHTKIFRNTFWTHQIKLLQVFLDKHLAGLSQRTSDTQYTYMD